MVNLHSFVHFLQIVHQGRSASNQLSFSFHFRYCRLQSSNPFRIEFHLIYVSSLNLTHVVHHIYQGLQRNIDRGNIKHFAQFAAKKACHLTFLRSYFCILQFFPYLFDFLLNFKNHLFQIFLNFLRHHLTLMGF